MGWREGAIDYVKFEKIDFKVSYFCYIHPCNLLRKLTFTPLLSIKNKIKNVLWICNITGNILQLKRKVTCYGHIGPPRGHNPFLQKKTYLNHLSIDINELWNGYFSFISSKWALFIIPSIFYIRAKEENMLGVPYFTGHNFQTTPHFLL